MAKQCRMCKRLDSDYYFDEELEDDIEYCLCEINADREHPIDDIRFDCDKAVIYKSEKRRSHACELWDEIYGDIE